MDTCLRRELEGTAWESGDTSHLNRLSRWECKVSIDLWSCRDDLWAERCGLNTPFSLPCTKHRSVSHLNTQRSQKPETPACFMDSPCSWNWHYKENFLGPSCLLPPQSQFPSSSAGHLQSLLSYVMFCDASCDQDLWAPLWLSQAKPVSPHLCDDPSPRRCL